MIESVSLVPIRASEIAIGVALPWPAYDWHGNLLFAAGFIPENTNQLENLVENGFCQDSSWEIPLDMPAPASAQNIKKITQGQLVQSDNIDNKEIVQDMDDIHWHVGQVLYLQSLDNSATRYTVRLIGFVKNKTVLISPPVIEGKLEFIREGQSFVVRAFSGKKAYAFTTAAVKMLHMPHPYLHLSYPKEVRCTVVRQGARAQVKIIAAISLGQPERIAAAVLTDLSMGGTSGIARQPLGKKGEEGRIKFKAHAAENDEYLNLKIILRSVSPVEHGEDFRHGFEFTELSSHDRLILSAFVHQTLVEAT